MRRALKSAAAEKRPCALCSVNPKSSPQKISQQQPKIPLWKQPSNRVWTTASETDATDADAAAAMKTEITTRNKSPKNSAIQRPQRQNLQKKKLKALLYLPP